MSGRHVHRDTYALRIPVGMSDLVILFGTPRMLRWATRRLIVR